MAKIITLGEILLRLTSPGYQKLTQSDSFDVCYGGAEANVAVSLAYFGQTAYFVTKVPDNPIGESAVASLRKYNVNCEYIARGGERLGIYFLENGVSLRATNVIYDRKNSSISEADPSDFDFDTIFEGADWFHFTGITPAISDKAAGLTKQAVMAAKRKKLMVSADLNYRSKLWTPEKAQSVMPELMRYTDVCIRNGADAQKMLGLKSGGADLSAGAVNPDAYLDIYRQMMEKYPFTYIASSLRESFSASDNSLSGIIYDGKEFCRSRKYQIRIVDRIGGGDAFTAGIIDSILEGKALQDTLEFAVAASALKHTIPGDANLVSRSEVEALLGGDGTGRIQR